MRFKWLLVPCVVAVLALAGCGSSDDTVSSTVTKSPTPTAGGGSATATPEQILGNASETVSPASSSTTAASSSAQGDPCDLLTDDEVSAAIAHPATQIDSMDPNTCEWKYDSGSDVLSFILVSFATNISSKTFDRELSAGSGAGLTITPVTGIGDAAFFNDSALVSLLVFKKGDDAYEVTVQGAGEGFSTAYLGDGGHAPERAIALDALVDIG